MEVLHITKTKNIKNIMKSKIFRNKPLLPQYNDIMKSNYGELYDENKGLIFGFPENINNRDKYIKDFVYWKTWGDDRNIFLKDADYDTYNEYQNKGKRIFSHLKPKEDIFSILLLDVKYEYLFGYYKHAQYAHMGILWDDMDVRYEHDDKPLVLLNYDVENTKIKRIIGTAKTSITNKNKIDVTLNI